MASTSYIAVAAQTSGLGLFRVIDGVATYLGAPNGSAQSLMALFANPTNGKKRLITWISAAPYWRMFDIDGTTWTEITGLPTLRVTIPGAMQIVNNGRTALVRVSSTSLDYYDVTGATIPAAKTLAVSNNYSTESGDILLVNTGGASPFMVGFRMDGSGTYQPISGGVGALAGSPFDFTGATPTDIPDRLLYYTRSNVSDVILSDSEPNDTFETVLQSALSVGTNPRGGKLSPDGKFFVGGVTAASGARLPPLYRRLTGTRSFTTLASSLLSGLATGTNHKIEFRPNSRGFIIRSDGAAVCRAYLLNADNDTTTQITLDSTGLVGDQSYFAWSDEVITQIDTTLGGTMTAAKSDFLAGVDASLTMQTSLAALQAAVAVFVPLLAVNFFIIGGGGGGGGATSGEPYAGGGGAGGNEAGTFTISGSHSFSVGAGGPSGSNSAASSGQQGSQTSAFGKIGRGGAPGAQYGSNGLDGACGGGAGGGAGSAPGGLATAPIQGFNGGGRVFGANGAGGGAGSAAADGTPGNAKTVSLSGAWSMQFGAGGPCGVAASALSGSGGRGKTAGAAPTAGVAGAVVIWYPGTKQRLSGGTVSILGGYVRHVFATAGNFTTTIIPDKFTSTISATLPALGSAAFAFVGKFETEVAATLPAIGTAINVGVYPAELIPAIPFKIAPNETKTVETFAPGIYEFAGPPFGYGQWNLSPMGFAANASLYFGTKLAGTLPSMRGAVDAVFTIKGSLDGSLPSLGFSGEIFIDSRSAALKASLPSLRSDGLAWMPVSANLGGVMARAEFSAEIAMPRAVILEGRLASLVGAFEARREPRVVEIDTALPAMRSEGFVELYNIKISGEMTLGALTGEFEAIRAPQNGVVYGVLPALRSRGFVELYNVKAEADLGLPSLAGHFTTFQTIESVATLGLKPISAGFDGFQTTETHLESTLPSLGSSVVVWSTIAVNVAGSMPPLALVGNVQLQYLVDVEAKLPSLRSNGVIFVEIEAVAAVRLPAMKSDGYMRQSQSARMRGFLSPMGLDSYVHLGQSARLTASLPSLGMSGSVKVPFVSQFAGSLASMSFEGYGISPKSAVLGASLKPMSMDGYVEVDLAAFLTGQMASLGMLFYAGPPQEVDFNTALPKLTGHFYANTPIFVTVAGSMPKLKISLDVLGGPPNVSGGLSPVSIGVGSFETFNVGSNVVFGYGKSII